MITPQVLDKIRTAIIESGRDTRYTIAAYIFVLQGLNFYHTKSGERRHFTGQELSQGLITFAHKQYGPMSYDVLRHMGITTTNDLGFIVYNLIDIKLIRKQESDCLEDFFSVFDIKEFLEKQQSYQIDKEFIKTVKGA